MTQIKTVYERIAGDFDRKVNAALKEGWRLKKHFTASDTMGPMFFAELVKDTGTCDDCRHRGTLLTEEPCISCGVSYANWEAAESDDCKID